MNKPSSPPLGRLRGAVRLAVDATAGVTDLVEAMHLRIARLPVPGAPTAAGRTTGITGLVYKSVRGITRFTGSSLDALLELLSRALPPATAQARPDREALVAVLNGVLGDHLAATGNPLATAMSLRHDGLALPALPVDTERVLLMIHGLCMNDLQWRRDGHDHGQVLARELGLTPMYLRYNSGQHVSSNGRELALLLETLLAADRPRPIERLVIVAHSMGGLVARSALHQAQAMQLRWPAALGDLVFLGTPHHGAPLERAGNWIDLLLGAAPYAAPLARLGKVRSAGITDLRHGYLLEADWHGRDRFARGAAHRTPVPLPTAVRCFAVAASLGEAGSTKGRLLGDGLVPLNSALGRHADPQHVLHFDAERQWVGHSMNHLQLLSDAAVCAQLLHWLA